MTETGDIKPIKVTEVPKEPKNGGVVGEVGKDIRLTTSDDLPDTINQYRLFDFLGIGMNSRQDSGVKERMSTVYQWAKAECKSDEFTNVMMAITHLENRLGVPKIGNDRVDHLFQYCRLQQEIRRSQAQMDAMFGERQ